MEDAFIRDIAMEPADSQQNGKEDVLDCLGESPEQLIWSRLEQKSSSINEGELQETPSLSEIDMEELKR